MKQLCAMHTTPPRRLASATPPREPSNPRGREGVGKETDAGGKVNGRAEMTDTSLVPCARS